MPPLSSAELANLGTASPVAVAELFRQLAGTWAAGGWLRSNNRYDKDEIERIKGDLARGRVTQSHLAEYITASSLLHVFDGWSLLGRAVECELSGDVDTARHLGYYAELRAAMSILASRGIGVFDRKHFVIPRVGRAKYVGGSRGTHEFAWDALDVWADSADSTGLLLGLIQPDGKPLSDWLTAFSTTAASDGIVTKEWIATWGLDLKRLKSDRKSRNLSSYRPSELHAVTPLPLSSITNCIAAFWRAAEPLGMTSFAMLDIYMLRQALDRKFKGVHPNGRTSVQARRAFRQQLEAMLHVVGPSTHYPFDWIGFLTREQLPADPLVISEAGGSLFPHQSGHELQVLARASLLLWLASASTKQLLRGIASTERALLRGRVAQMSERVGRVSPGSFPDDALDFWADVEIALDEVEAWCATVPEPEQSRHRFFQECPESSKLADAEIAGIWALGV